MGHPKDSGKHTKNIPRDTKNQVPTGSHGHPVGLPQYTIRTWEGHVRQHTNVLTMFSEHCRGIFRESLGRPRKSGK